MTIGARLHSSPRSYNPVRHATVPLTASCWLLTLPSSTSGISLKVAASTFSLTTSPSPMLCRRIQTASPPGRSDIWTTSPSSRLTFTTSRDLAMLQQMPLSCIHLETNAILNSSHAIDFSVIAAAQHRDPELRKWKSQPFPSLQLSAVPLPGTTTTLICDISTGTSRPFIPASFRRQVYNSLHSLSHPGIRATQQLITSRFVWPGINKDVRMWARACLQCQCSKVHRHTVTSTSILLDPFHTPEDTHICSPALTASHLGLKPSLSQISQLRPLPEPSSGWIAHFCTPSTISTDKGCQFESELFTHLMQLLGTKRIHTTAYHPIANGLVEHLHRQQSDSGFRIALSCTALELWQWKQRMVGSADGIAQL